jgi:hypothetical protein
MRKLLTFLIAALWPRVISNANVPTTPTSDVCRNGVANWASPVPAEMTVPLSLEIDECECKYQDRTPANQKLFGISIEHNPPPQGNDLSDAHGGVESISPVRIVVD